MRRLKCRWAAIPLVPALVLLGLIVSIARAVQAQGDPAEVAASTARNLLDRRPRNLLLLLYNLVYDTNDRPPLVVVDAARWLPYAPLPEGSITITPLANRAGLRLVSAGHVSALVPPMMTLLNDKPARANPFAGMRPDETLKLLLGTLDHAQWRLIGGADGIGQGDLTDDQRLLWDEIVPASMQVQKSTLQPGKEPGSWEYTDTTFLPVEQPEAIRIRLNRHTTFMFYKAGSSDIASGGDPYQFDQTAGQTRYTLLPGSTKAAQSSRDTSSAYGVALTTTQTNRLKPSAVDYNSPSLDQPISLHFPPGPPIAPSEAATNAEMPAGFNRPEALAEDMARLPANVRERIGPDFLAQYRALNAKVRADAAVVVARKTELPTVGDILLRISQATKFEFVADGRVRDSLVFLRGDSARSGDVLQALARSVTGAFRKIDGVHGGRQIYLLTCDVEGVGARATRLAEWAEAAEELKRKTMDGIIKRIAVNDPSSSLTFAPDDKFALSTGEARTTEENWQLDEYQTEIKREDLSPGLRDAADASQSRLNEDGISLRNDRIQVGEELSLSLIVPGIGPIQDTYTGQGIAFDFLRQISRNPARVDAAQKKAALSAKSSAAPPPVGFPAKLKRRILLTKPATADEAAALVRMAAKKGITDVWLSVSLADVPATVALIQTAIKAGAGRIAVGAAVSLLQNGGIPGEPERNIEGETGDEYRLRSQSKWVTDVEKTAHDYGFDQYKGWIVPDRTEMTTRLKTLAAVPGLAGLVLLSTAAPGWTGEKQGGDDILTELGYSVETRRQFLRAYGIDPIDIPEDSYYLAGVIQWNFGPFEIESANENYTVVNHRMVSGPADAVPRSALLSFRAKENIHMLAGLYAELRGQSPHLPLLLDDRVSPYGEQRPLSWFGSWDAGDRLPVNPPFAPPDEGRAAARQASKTIFADWGWWWSAADAKKDGAPVNFALKVTAAAYRNGPPAWDGMAMDMTNVPTADLLRLLDGLPTATATLDR